MKELGSTRFRKHIIRFLAAAHIFSKPCAQVKRMTFSERGDLYSVMRYISVHLRVNLCSSRSHQSCDTVKGVGNKLNWF